MGRTPRTATNVLLSRRLGQQSIRWHFHNTSKQPIEKGWVSQLKLQAIFIAWGLEEESGGCQRSCHENVFETAGRREGYFTAPLFALLKCSPALLCIISLCQWDASLQPGASPPHLDHEQKALESKSGLIFGGGIQCEFCQLGKRENNDIPCT